MYGEIIPPNEMHVVTPSQATLDTLNIFHENFQEFEDAGISTIHNLSQMDIEKTSHETGVDIEKLTKLKNMAITELRNEDQLTEFIKESDIG